MKFWKSGMIIFKRTKFLRIEPENLSGDFLRFLTSQRKRMRLFPNGSLSFHPPLRTNSAICATIAFGSTLPKCRQSRDFLSLVPKGDRSRIANQM